MPNVIDGTGRLIRRKIKARFRKVNLFFKANRLLGDTVVYTKLSAADYRKIEIMRPVRRSERS